ncbi:hypothetical protein M9H77_17257 [Catharanthus roseus]|uniref:Uncharacterized protein n=1 Tax=Catharanthus roseus TaxID=4058 RepID=A0ACC0B444_CATRO|nr:hypothetical protein M9H77_17257 [Catharanthus roseus]
METSMSSVMLYPLFSFLSILLFFTRNEPARHIPHDDFLKCLESQISNSRSQKYEIQIQVRSGGHDYEGLPYSSQVPFVMVDLQKLNSISIDKENHKAKIQAGAALGEIYCSIAKESWRLAFPAENCPSVGVGGHFSGGGFSMMFRRFGQAANYIVGAKVKFSVGKFFLKFFYFPHSLKLHTYNRSLPMNDEVVKNICLQNLKHSYSIVGKSLSPDTTVNHSSSVDQPCYINIKPLEKTITTAKEQKNKKLLIYYKNEMIEPNKDS